MATTDPIADLLTRIRNGMHARKDSCEIPASKTKEQIVKILNEAGLINGYVRQEEKPQDRLIVQLKYTGKLRKPAINKIKRVSKPGCRVYRGYDEIKPLLEGYGFAIISTSKGLMKDVDAMKQKIGGEVLCEVW
jgi:small subunit ribosomal protein S8